jgi:hypothetical protein
VDSPRPPAKPKCIRHHSELADMEDAVRSIKADPMMSITSRRNADGQLRKPVVFHGHACTSPDCDGFYSAQTGYSRWASGSHRNSDLPAAIGPKCAKHKSYMYAFERKGGQTYFECPQCLDGASAAVDDADLIGFWYG